MAVYPNSTLGFERPNFRIGPFKLYISDRLMEWFAALLMVCDAIVLCFPGASVTGAFGMLMRQGVPVTASAVIFGVFGVSRVLALAANGNIPVYGPRARAVGAIVACPIWASMGMAQLMDAVASGRVSLAVPTYLLLALAELASAIRATYDVGRI